MSKVTQTNQSAASISTPSSGKTSIFIDTDKLLKTKDDTGTVINYGAPNNAITALTGEVTATGPGSAAATVTNSAVLAKVLTGYTPSAGTVSASDTILQAFNKLGARQDIAWFGDGHDGVVTYTTNTTLVRDMYFSSLTVNPGVILDCAGFRIHSQQSIVNNGTITRVPNSSTSSTGASGLLAGTVAGSTAGGNGGGAGAGTAGTAIATALGGVGGTGGTGSAGAGAAGGTVTLPSVTQGGADVLCSVRQAVVCQILGATPTLIQGGSGGGGGGGSGVASSGGGGGCGGGIVVLMSTSITGSGTITAPGGNGANAQLTNGGGGAGGGGGIVILVSINDPTTSSLTISAPGGAGGAGLGSGVAGAPGSIGRVYITRV